MKRTARIVFVLFVLTLATGLPLMADNGDWPDTATEFWTEYRIVEVVPFALRYVTEPGPIDLPPWLPSPETNLKTLNLSMSPEVGNGAVSTINVPTAMGNLGSSAAAIPGSRAGSFMSEQRLAERSLRGTIKRLE